MTAPRVLLAAGVLAAAAAGCRGRATQDGGEVARPARPPSATGPAWGPLRWEMSRAEVIDVTQRAGDQPETQRMHKDGRDLVHIRHHGSRGTLYFGDDDRLSQVELGSPDGIGEADAESAARRLEGELGPTERFESAEYVWLTAATRATFNASWTGAARRASVRYEPAIDVRRHPGEGLLAGAVACPALDWRMRLEEVRAALRDCSASISERRVPPPTPMANPDPHDPPPDDDGTAFELVKPGWKGSATYWDRLTELSWDADPIPEADADEARRAIEASFGPTRWEWRRTIRSWKTPSSRVSLQITFDPKAGKWSFSESYARPER